MKKVMKAWLDGVRVLCRIIWFSVVVGLMLLPVRLLVQYLWKEVYDKRPPVAVVVVGIVGYLILLPFIMHLASRWSGEFKKPTEPCPGDEPEPHPEEERLPPYLEVEPEGTK